MNIVIRQATSSDAAEIAEIYKYYVENTAISFETSAPDTNEICRRINVILQNGLPYIVAVHNGKIVGYANAHYWKERAAYYRTWETSVYVLKSETSQGVGTQLMTNIINYARTFGCHTLIACITAENMSSRHFHEQLGFQQTSMFRQVGFKLGRYLDVTDYQLVLD